MATELRTDFENLSDGERITLHPRDGNLLHKRPVKATFQSGYFYCDGTNPMDGPDYYFGDVFRECAGFTAA